VGRPLDRQDARRRDARPARPLPLRGQGGAGRRHRATPHRAGGLMLRDAILFMSESRLMRRIATEAPFASGVARRFVAGETLDDAVQAARAINETGAHVTLDYLGESVSSREEAVAAADVYLQLLDRIAAERLDANASLKLTQMGQDIDEAFLRENVGRVLDSAREKQIFIRDRINETGAHVTLDYLGESVSSREEAVAAADVYLQLLDRIAAERLDANASLKLTQMGQDIDEAFLRENVGRVLDSAREKQIFI